MSEVTYDPDRYTSGWDDVDASETAESGGWRNPSYAVRVLLVGAVWAMPGVLVGLMANLVLSVAADPIAAATAGGVLFAFAGGRLEASG